MIMNLFHLRRTKAQCVGMIVVPLMSTIFIISMRNRSIMFQQISSSSQKYITDDIQIPASV